MQEGAKTSDSKELKSLIIVSSYHHKNTEKIAEVFSNVLKAPFMAPEQVTLDQLEEYDLIGFGSGIDSGKHYKPLLDFADTLPETKDKVCFIFSTSALQGNEKVDKDHSLLREKLQSKGFRILGEFSCKGFNTNSFLKYFGGLNRGKPDVKDLKNAEKFALGLVSQR